MNAKDDYPLEFPEDFRRYRAAMDEIDALRDALRWFIDDETCSYNHRGACQTHGNSAPGCRVADARELLGMETA